MATAVAPHVGHGTLQTVEVHHPTRQRSVILEGLHAGTPLSDIRARATGELRLPADVNWNLRDEQSGRLLNDSHTLGDIKSRTGSHVELVAQPDAGLG